MYNYVTFKIIETRDGDFIQYLHNHDQKLISEQYRSRDLDEAVDRLKEKISYRRHFMNALGNYVPVLETLDKLEEKYPAGKGEDFPVGWTGIVGANGVGKTTLLKLATGALEPHQGTIHIPGDAIYCPQRTDEAPLSSSSSSW